MEYKVDDKELNASIFSPLLIKYGRAIMTSKEQRRHYLKR